MFMNVFLFTKKKILNAMKQIESTIDDITEFMKKIEFFKERDTYILS